MGQRKRKPPKAVRKPSLSVAQILDWARGHHEQTGQWPNLDSGAVVGTFGEEKWVNIDQVLRIGLRGLPGKQTLAGLLWKELGVRNPKKPPPLTEAKILAWARAHRRRTGEWPTAESGPVEGAPGEAWCNIDAALARGNRGLAGGSSVAQLLGVKVGTRNKKRLPLLDLQEVLRWADAYRARTGRWPGRQSGPIPEAAVPGETWMRVDSALRGGLRGQRRAARCSGCCRRSAAGGTARGRGRGCASRGGSG